MTPSDKPTGEIRAIAREEADAAADAARDRLSAEQRVAREKASTRIGWGLFIVAGLIVLGSAAVDIFAHRQRPELSAGVVTVVVLLAFGGGALVQGVRLDRILTAWRKSEPPA